MNPSSKRLLLRTDLIERPDADHLFLFDPVSGELLHLNPTARMFWEHLRQGGSASSLESIIHERFAGFSDAGQPAADVLDFCSMLVARGFASWMEKELL